MKNIICRFAPSPTGFLHVGNIRVAVLNSLFCQKYNGEFLLRFDDTDEKRTKEEYKKAIIEDFKWLEISYSKLLKQSDNGDKYEIAKDFLIKSGRLYECFESEVEIKMQRNLQIANGQRPIYDRSALNLTNEQKENLKSQGIKPYYRFLINDSEVSWDDEVKGKISFTQRSFSDPVLVRENGIPTYTFCSVVDDIEHKISHIMRGEDHITNTAVQIQIFQALGAEIPKFMHFPLIKHNSGKISKRIGGFDIKQIREEGKIEPMAVMNLLSQLGTSENNIYEGVNDLVKKFDIKNFGKAAVNYDEEMLVSINQKIVANMSFNQVHKKLTEIGFNQEISPLFWKTIQSNILDLTEVKSWYKIIYEEFSHNNNEDDKEFLQQIVEILPEDTASENAWNSWIGEIKKISDRKGKNLFMPIRLALTGRSHGPEMKNILRLINRKEILKRLTSS
jgi:glutamyl-tRNA synthetase